MQKNRIDKLKQLWLILISIPFFFHPVFADYFPFEQGNMWEFNYTQLSGGMIGSSTSTGTLKWEVTSVEVLESMPVQYRINIKQTRSLVNYTSDYIVIIDTTTGSTSVDTTHDPPIVTEEDRVIRGTEGVNGLFLEYDTCWSFIHEKSGGETESKVLVSDTSFSFSAMGVEMPAIKVDPSPCLNGTGGDIIIMPFYGPTHYILADNIGPVGYHVQSSPMLMDAYFQEDWSLTSTNVNDTGVTSLPGGKPLSGAAKSTLTGSLLKGQVILNLTRGDVLTLEYSDVKGVTRQLLSPALFTPGRHILDLPDLPRGSLGFLTLKGFHHRATIKTVR